jgi:hypothetical protein
MSSASAFEESVQARMDAIKFQKEQDLIEIEARRRLNVQKKNEMRSKKKAASQKAKEDYKAATAEAEAVLENEKTRLEKAQAKQAKVDNEAAMAAKAAVLENERARLEKARAAEMAKAEEEKRVTIMGFNARIRTIQRDIDVCLYSYKKINSYFKFLPSQPQTIAYFNNILYDIKKEHDAHLALLAVKTLQLQEFTKL